MLIAETPKIYYLRLRKYTKTQLKVEEENTWLMAQGYKDSSVYNTYYESYLARNRMVKTVLRNFDTLVHVKSDSAQRKESIFNMWHAYCKALRAKDKLTAYNYAVLLRLCFFLAGLDTSYDYVLS